MKINALLLLTLMVSACQTSKIANRTIDKKYEKNEFKFKTIQSPPYELTYWDNESDNPPLLLIHGFGTWTKFNWHHQIKDLGDQYRVIIPNLLHFGKSTCQNCGYSINDQVSAIEYLIDDLGIHEFYLVGASYGGVVAIELSQKRAKSINKLIIIDSPIKYFTSEEIQNVASNFGVASIQDLLIPTDHKQLKNLSKILYKHPPLTPSFAYKNIYEVMFEPFEEEMTLMLNSLIDQRSYFADREYSYDKPILLIWGEEDELVPNRVGQSLNEYFISNSQLIIIENTAHMPILEKPKLCNEIILNFLTNNSD